MQILGKRHRRYIEIGAGCIEDNGAIRVYLDRLPIGGFNGFLHLLPEGMPPPDVKPQRPAATSDDGDEEPEENF